MTKRILQIERGEEDGEEYVALDLLTSAYFQKLLEKQRFALLAATDDDLPFLGYLIETTDLSDQVVAKQERNFLDGVPSELELPECVRAVRITIKGGKDIEDNRDYERGCQVGFASGILTDESQKWNNCRLIRGFSWAAPIWEKVGFDFEERRMWRELKKVKYRAKAGFLKMEPVKTCITRKEGLLLVINMLFNYWERKRLSYAHRALHLERLGFKYKFGDTNIGNYFAEAGCTIQSRVKFLDELESVRKNAIRYYERNPTERELLEEEGGVPLFRIGLPKPQK